MSKVEMVYNQYSQIDIHSSHSKINVSDKLLYIILPFYRYFHSTNVMTPNFTILLRIVLVLFLYQCHAQY